jgi:hypothetical protein
MSGVAELFGVAGLSFARLYSKGLFYYKVFNFFCLIDTWLAFSTLQFDKNIK